MIKEYEIGVVEFAPNTATSTESLTLSNTSITTGHNYYTSPYTWYTSPVYLYQIFCPKPRCKTVNWLELNKEKECIKCKSLLRAVSRKIDYEVEIDV